MRAQSVLSLGKLGTERDCRRTPQPLPRSPVLPHQGLTMGPGLPVRPIGPAGPRKASCKRTQGTLRKSGATVPAREAPPGKKVLTGPRTGASAGGGPMEVQKPRTTAPLGPLSPPRMEERRRRGACWGVRPPLWGWVSCFLIPSQRPYPAPGRPAPALHPGNEPETRLPLLG